MRHSTANFGLLLVAMLVVLLGSNALVQGAVVAHWNFDNNLLDDSGNGNHLSVATGATSYGAPGPNGGAASFDFNGATMLNNVTPSNFGFTSAYTFAAWVQAPLPNATAYHGTFWVGTPGTSDIEVYTQLSSNAMVTVHNRGNGGTFAALVDNDPPDNVYYHLAIVYNGTNTTTYFNGVAQTTQGMAAPQNTPGRQVSLGKLNHSQFTPNFLTGLMDEAFVFDHALNATQLNNLILFNDINGPQAVIPEPATLALVALGGLGLAFRGRRNRQRSV